jgi:hypothetical protein
MEISLTQDQYENLIKLVFLGSWLVNSFRTDRITDFDELENHIYSYAKDSGLQRCVAYDEATKEYTPSDALEESVASYIEEYDEDSFWDELVRSLGQRDFIRQYGQAAIQKMKFEEMLEKEDPFIQKYAQEFEKNGLQHLGLIEPE